MVTVPSAVTEPVRKPIEDRWPSPTPRTLTTNCAVPDGSSGECSTADGLHRAAPSIEYSWVNDAPSSSRRAAEMLAASPSMRAITSSACSRNTSLEVAVTREESLVDVGELGIDLVLVQIEHSLDDHRRT
jgi:hypothetical protein